MEQDFTDLYSLQFSVRDGLEAMFPDKMWVKAEIGSINVKSNGHCYLELVQSEGGSVIAKARAVIWRTHYSTLSAMFSEETGSNLAAGQEILVQAQVNYHEVFGFSLVIDDINPSFTLGQQQLKRRQTVEKLTAEGLMDRQKALRIPDIPYYLAVISAEGAAGLGDFYRHLLENAYGYAYDLEFYSATMQGEAAPQSIVETLGRIEAAPVRYDAVLILRGGGSDADLSCFDDYALAAAIARLPLPVVTAIGHDKDFHVADMVACVSVKTPTALADLFIEKTATQDGRIDAFETRLSLAFQNRINSMASRIDLLEKEVVSTVRLRLDRLEHGISLLEMKISDLDPRRILSRGYSLVLDSNGVRMSSASGRTPGDRISVLFADGKLAATVDEVYNDRKKGNEDGRDI